MSYLTAGQIIDILIIFGYGDKTRTHKKIGEVFNNKSPHRRSSHLTVNRVQQKFK